LNHIHLTIRLHLKAMADMSKLPILLGRLLAALTTLLIIVTPVTEHLWTWDKFLRGGQDFEFGLLGIASILCLVLVLSQHYKQVINLLLTMRRLLVFALHLDHGSLQTIPEIIADFRRGRTEAPALGTYNLPLQI
jgi:hypothetical protein